MSFKRQAPSELNHENWNEEDPEDDKVMGQFKAASKDVLEKRVIRTARRRNPVASEPSKSVFSGFGGFNKAQPTSFDFLANLTNGKNTNGATCTSNSVTPGLFTNKATNSGLFGAQSLASLAPQPNQSTMMASPFGTSIKTSQSTLFTNTNQPNQSTMVESPFGTSIKSSQSTLFTNTNQQNRSTMMESPFGTSIESSQSTLFTNKNQPNQSTMMESPFGTSVKSSQSTLFTNTNQPNQSTMMESPFGTSIKSLQSTLFTNTNQSTMIESPIGTSIKTSQSTLFTNTNFGIKETPFQIQPITNTTQPESMKSSAKPTLSVFGVSTTMTNDKKLFTPTPFQIQTSNTNTTMVQTCFGIIVTPTVTTGTPTVTTVTTTVTTVKPTVTTVTPTMNTVRPIVNTVTTEKKTDVVKCRNEKKIKYFSKLKGLNESVSDWISQHVVKTPFCILSPIFKDYEKYLKEITEEYENADKGVSDNMENLESKTQNINTKISPFFDKTGSSPNASNKANEDTEQSGAFGVSSSNTSNNGISNQDTKIPSFGVTNTSSSMVSQNTKMSSPFAINCYTSPSNTQNTKISSPYAVNNTISSLLPISKSLPFGFNNTGSTPLKSQETKTPPFAIANSNVSSFNTSPSNANPKPVFGGQNNPLSSPENKPNFSFGINTSTAGTSIAATPSTGFSFGVTPSAPIANTSSFTISTNLSTNQTNPPPFSFGTGKPFSFSPNTIAQQPNLEKTTAENEEDEPPKVEYTPVKEENSVYEKKCKIFFKKDGNFVDKGVGTLYIKKIEGNEKHQLLVRANTNLGTVLLNLVLAEAIPTQRMGKNNVMLVCIPTPDSKPPPTPILIRVKTAEEADELLETLNKYKA